VTQAPSSLPARRAQTEAYLALHHVHGEIRARAAAGFVAVGLDGITPAQADALMVLFQHRAPMTARQLARELGLSEVTVGRFVKALEVGGWVERSPDPNDARARLLSPTPQAYDALPRFIEVSNQVLDGAFVGFTDDEVAAFAGLVRRVRENLAE
jgi:DNA-binding MarR family transcriptional regulator